MDDLVLFFRRYFRLEFEIEDLRLARDPSYVARCAESAGHWYVRGAGVPLLFLTPADNVDDLRASFYERHLFKVSLRSDSQFGRIARAYVSDTNLAFAPDSYAMALDAAVVEGLPKILGEYSACRVCACTGVIPKGRRHPRAGEPCDNCDGEGWKFIRGLRLSYAVAPSKFVVLKIPTRGGRPSTSATSERSPTLSTRGIHENPRPPQYLRPALRVSRGRRLDGRVWGLGSSDQGAQADPTG